MIRRTFLLIFFLIITPFSFSVAADRIEYFSYTTCYSSVQMREAPNIYGKKITIIPKGIKVRVSEQKGHWIKVIYIDNNDNYWVGWVASTAMCPGK